MAITKQDIRDRYELGNPATDTAIGSYDAAVISANPKLYYKFQKYQAYRDKILTHNPLVYIPCKDISGTTATDISGNANHGTYQGTYTLNQPTITKNTNGGPSVKIGNTSGSQIPMSSLGALDFPVTLEAWVDNINSVVLGGIIGTHNQTTAYKGFMIFIISGNIWAVYGIGGAGFGTGTSRRFQTNGAPIATGTKYHIAAVFTSQTDVKIYINGAEYTDITITGTAGPVVTDAGTPSIGGSLASGTGTYNVLDGDLQEAVIYNSALTAQDIIDHYKLGIQGGVFDKMNNHDGDTLTVNGGGALGLITSDPSEFSMDFDGTKRYINLGRYFNYTDVFSIECWINPDHTNTGDTRPILTRWGSGSNDNVSLYIIDDTIYFGVRDSDTTTWRQVSATISKAKHYIVAIYNPVAANKLELYIDNALAGSNATVFTIDTTSIDEKETYVGRLGSDLANDNYSGIIDDLAIYNAALSVGQITQHYGLGKDNFFAYTAHVLQHSPEVYYKMDDNTTTLQDSSGNGNNLTIQGTYTLQEKSLLAEEANSVLLDPTGLNNDAFALGPDIGNLTYPVTIEFWWEPTDLSKSQIGLVATHYDPTVYAGFAVSYSTTSNYLSLAIGTGNGIDAFHSTFFRPNPAVKNFIPEIGKKYHIVYTITGNTVADVKLYINGVNWPDLVQANSSITLGWGSGVMAIGKWFTNNGCGYIDEVAIYNSILPESEIDIHYQLGILGDVPLSTYQAEVVADGPVAYWRLDEQKDYSAKVLTKTPTAYYKMDEESGTTIADSSGNGYNGTISSVGGGSYALNAEQLVIDGTRCIQFNNSGANGNGAKIIGPSLGAMSFPVTLEAWIQIDSWNHTTFPIIVTHHNENVSYNGFTLSVNSAGNIRPGYGAGGGFLAANSRFYTSANGIIELGKRYHVVVVFHDNTNATAYVNGVAYTLTNDFGTANTLDTSAGVVAIGIRDTGGSAGTEYYADGRIDHAAIYESGLTATEILEHYQEGVVAFDITSNYDVQAVSDVVFGRKSLIGDALSKSMEFNNGHLYVDNAVLGTGNLVDLSLEFWILLYKDLVGYGSTPVIIKQTRIDGLDYNVNLRLRAAAGNERKVDFDVYLPSGGDISGTVQLTVGKIHHVVYTQTSSSRNIYVDGVLDNSDAGVETYGGAGTTHTYIGKDYDGTANVPGVLGELAMYNYTLPLERIQKHYIEGLRGIKAAESYETEVLKNSPLAFLRLIETTGSTAVDYSGNGNNFTHTNTPTLGLDAMHEGIHPGRSVSYLSAQSEHTSNSAALLVNNNSDVTVEAWSECLGTTSNHRLTIARAGGVGWDVTLEVNYNTGAIIFAVVTTSGGTVQHTVTVNDPDIQTVGHVGYYVGVFSQGSYLELYKDGVKIGELTTGVNSTLRGANHWTISRNATETLYRTAKVQDVAIYGTALTAADIFNHYIEGSRTITYGNYITTQQNMPNISPLAIWRFNETSGTTAVDSSGNGNHLSYVNGATYGHDSLVPEAGVNEFSANTDFASGAGPEISAPALTYTNLTGNNCIILEVLFKLDSIHASLGGGLLCTHDNGLDYAGVSLLSAAVDGHLILRIGAGNLAGMNNRKSWTTTEPLQVGRIYHAVAILQDINNAWIFLNGVELATTTSTAGSPAVNLNPGHGDTCLGVNTTNISIPDGYHLDAKFGYAAIYECSVPCGSEVARTLWLRNGNKEPYYESVLSKNPYAHWSMNHDGVIANGEVVVESIGNIGHDATVVETNTVNPFDGLANGRFRKYGGLNFNGTSGDYINLGNLGKINWPFTLECWLEIGSNGPHAVFDSNVNIAQTPATDVTGFFVRVDASNKVMVGFGGGGAWTGANYWFQISTNALSLSTRYHIVCQWLASQSVKVFINGVEETMTGTSGTETVVINTGHDKVGLVGWNPGIDSGTTYADMLIDSLTLYKYLLSSAQILENYNAGA